MIQIIADGRTTCDPAFGTKTEVKLTLGQKLMTIVFSVIAPAIAIAGEADTDATKGRLLFAEKGCILCHSVNGVGGGDAAPLDASENGKDLNPFDLAAKMWAMAPYMIEAQEAEMGAQILFSGKELSDIIAFLQDEAEQHKFTEDTLPVYIREILEHGQE